MMTTWYKRPLDITLALFGLVFFSPLIILFSFLIHREDGGPIFYKQVRIGKDRKEFQILKFRSMSTDSQELPTCNLKSDAHVKITRIGNFLRATAMDELPQLINILRGDMSFVGPRPIMPCEVDGLDSHVRSVRLKAKPGLTGLAQLYADKYIANNDKIKHDLAYMENQSIWLDIKIIFYSIIVTLHGRWEMTGKKVNHTDI
jgi:lipopolysaccharide/colanic/teichoic acid biosynthesis glycosyltransferase